MFIITRVKIVICLFIAAAILIGVIVALADVPATPASVARAYLHKMGWETEQKPIEIVQLEIPQEWDDVYLQYNEIQKRAGFDLAPYKGSKVERCTFAIKNFDGEENVRANVLVSRGKVIGGDLSTVSISGFMIPLEERKNVIEEVSILEE